MSNKNCYLSSSTFFNKDLDEVIKECRVHDIFSIELSAPHPFVPLDILEDKLLECKEEGFNFTLHNYFPPSNEEFILNIASGNLNNIKQSKGLINKAIDLASKIDSPVYGIHAGYLAEAKADSKGYFHFDKEKNDYNVSLDNAVSFLNDLRKELSDVNVKIIIENLFPNQDFNNSLFCSFDQVHDLATRIHESFGFLLDLGHLNISSHLLGFDKYMFLEKYLELYGDRVYEVHLSENSGSFDDHDILKPGAWQFEAIKMIESVPLKGKIKRIYCLEARNAKLNDILKSLDTINVNIEN